MKPSALGPSWQLTVPARFERLAQIAEFVTHAARDSGLSDGDVFHVEMAVDEACSNVIEHAYAERAGNIELECRCPEPGVFEVIIRDSGEPFDPDSVPLPQVSADMSLDELNEGGLGLYFMRKLMDEVRFESVPGQGNVLRMTKRARQPDNRE
jgi:anti-sigma regulatory factor (Ser/Thr protein kinase)